MKSTYYIIIAIASVLGLAIAEDSANFYKSAKNKTYFIETRNKANWYASWMDCQNRGMTFLVIDSPEKSQEIIELINENFKEKDKPLLYIAANNNGNSQYLWVTTGRDVQYTNWSELEPNNYGNDEHCVHIGLYEDGTWNDVDCERHFGYICE